MNKYLCKILLSTAVLMAFMYSNEVNADTREESINIERRDIGFDPIIHNIEKEKESNHYIGKRFFVDHPNIPSFKEKEDILNNKMLDNHLLMGAYYNILEYEVIKGVTYFKVNLSEKSPNYVWISENNNFKYVSKNNVSKPKDRDVERSYFTLTEDVHYYNSINLNRKTRKVSTDTLVKNTKFTILNETTVTTEKDATLWYLISYDEVFGSLDDANKYAKDTSFEIVEKEGKYIVRVSGWINHSYVSNVKMTNLKSEQSGNLEISRDLTKVMEVPSEDSHVKGIIGIKTGKKLGIKDTYVQDVENKKEQWYYIQEIDSDGAPLDKKPVYIQSSEFTETLYTVVKAKNNIKNKLVTVEKDIVTRTKPEGAKGSKEKGTLEKDDYAYAYEELFTKKGDESGKYYSLKSEDGKSLGIVSEKDINFVEGNTLKYTIKKGDTLESILSKFNLTNEEFNRMNIVKVYGSDSSFEFKEGNEVVVKQPEIVYDKRNVIGTSSGIKLVEEMMHTAPVILEARIKPSVAYAQAILESGGGTSGLAVRNNNLFGIKGTYRGNGSSWATLEDSGGGNMYSINATFRAYPNKMASILDYVDLITKSGIYNRAIGLSTSRETVQAIRDSGYATDAFYVSKVMSIVEKYDLEQFDNL